MKCREVQKSICNIGKLKLRIGLPTAICMCCVSLHMGTRGALSIVFFSETAPGMD